MNVWDLFQYKTLSVSWNTGTNEDWIHKGRCNIAVEKVCYFSLYFERLFR